MNAIRDAVTKNLPPELRRYCLSGKKATEWKPSHKIFHEIDKSQHKDIRLAQLFQTIVTTPGWYDSHTFKALALTAKENTRKIKHLSPEATATLTKAINATLFPGGIKNLIHTKDNYPTCWLDSLVQVLAHTQQFDTILRSNTGDFVLRGYLNIAVSELRANRSPSGLVMKSLVERLAYLRIITPEHAANACTEQQDALDVLQKLQTHFQAAPPKFTTVEKFLFADARQEARAAVSTDAIPLQVTAEGKSIQELLAAYLGPMQNDNVYRFRIVDAAGKEVASEDNAFQSREIDAATPHLTLAQKQQEQIRRLQVLHPSCTVTLVPLVTKEREITSVPSSLQININRIGGNFSPVVSKTIDLTAFTSAREAARYALQAIICRIGKNDKDNSDGHFYAIIVQRDSTWKKFDDSSVTCPTGPELPAEAQQTGYSLIYSKTV